MYAWIKPEIKHINHPLLCICPVDLFLIEVNGESVGPAKIRGHDHLTLITCHGGSLYLGSAAPVGPENVAGKEKQCQQYPQKEKILTQT